jgi:hypothetical protein
MGWGSHIRTAKVSVAPVLLLKAELERKTPEA